MNMNEQLSHEFRRRDFLKGTSFAAMMSLMGAIPIPAEEEKKPATAPTSYKVVEDPLAFGVIGCGKWGREVIQALSRRPNAPVLGICDTYKPFLNRCKDMAPKAEPLTDYQQLLAKKEIQAVVVATPSHLHKDIVIAALQAGKHVYCEAPMATTLEDARAIAQAAKTCLKVNFQVGLQNRSDPPTLGVGQLIRSGVVGKFLKVRSQAHRKQIWRVSSPNPDREKDANWRLDPQVSLGLIGELGIHQIDLAIWYLSGRPKAVTGFGALQLWKEDGREIPDTVQAIFEYPEGVTQSQELTIANSFEGDNDVYYGSDSAIMMRDRKAWMFKESDAPLAGWEVYARKENFYKESGIVLGADATKLGTGKPSGGAAGAATTNAPSATVTGTVTPAIEENALDYALKRFVTNSLLVGNGVEDFVSSFGDKDLKALQEYLTSMAKTRLPAASWKEGYDSAIVAIKANEAITKKQRILFSKEWFEVA